MKEFAPRSGLDQIKLDRFYPVIGLDRLWIEVIQFASAI
jgi:hypothetical protein